MVLSECHFNVRTNRCCEPNLHPVHSRGPEVGECGGIVLSGVFVARIGGVSQDLFSVTARLAAHHKFITRVTRLDFGVHISISLC